MIEETQSFSFPNEIPSDRRSLLREGDTYGRVSTAAVKNGTSPYLQRLAHSRFIQVVPPETGPMDQRRRLLNTRRRSTSMIRPCIEIPGIDDQVSTADYLDLQSFFADTTRASYRPRSAPTRVLKKKKKVKLRQSSALQSFVTMITIYRNGDFSRKCYCRVTTLANVFNFATEKLQMAAAARRLFDSNGQEIVRVENLQHDQEYFVSSGENFKDPYRPLQTQAEYGANSRWTMKGIQTSADKPDTFKTKAVISKRLDKQIHLNISLTIIKNGCGKTDGIHHLLIDAARKKHFPKFLEDSTDKMGLTNPARRAFNYRGQEIKSLKEFFRWESSTMQHVSEGTIYGPLWLTSGEPFRPIGAFDYLRNRHREFVSHRNERREIHHEVLLVIEEKKRRKQRRGKKSDDESSDDESERNRPKIKNRDLLSMNGRELEEHRQKLEKEIEEAGKQMDLYQSRIDEIPAERDAQNNVVDRFTNDHIKEIKFNDKIVGRHPLQLIVHRNGTMKESKPNFYLDLRPLPRNSVGKTPIEYLLIQLQHGARTASEQQPKRVFDIHGDELKMIGQLKPLQHIFVSSGEEFQKPFQSALAIEIHSVDVYKRTNENLLLRAVRPEDNAMSDREIQLGRNVSTTWRPVHSVPDGVQSINFETLPDQEKQTVANQPFANHVPTNVTFLGRSRRLIYPELQIKRKAFPPPKPKPGEKVQKRVFSSIDLQTWFYDKEGFIYNKCLKNLFLTVVRDVEVKLEWTPNDLNSRRAFHEQLTGFAVQLREKIDAVSTEQIWKFTTDGFIVLESDQNFALTDLSAIFVDAGGEFTINGHQVSEDNPFIAFAGFCPKSLPNSPFVTRQRWAIRQDSGFTIGDWRFSKVKNPQWHKLGLVWPVDANGNQIPDLQWPVEGLFIPQVPPINQLTTGQTPAGFVPIRLQVLKNGERELRKAVAVVGPDISNLIFEPKATPNVYRRLRIPEPEGDQRAQRQIQRMADARQREIKLFLENCTELCKLPFAGRRLFDTRGIEIFDLTSIPRDSYVYVTCGENWIDPALTKAEEQRRLLLANLSHDIRMMYFFCAMRHPQEYAISAETSLTENSRLILNRCGLSAKQRERVRLGESIEHVIQSHDPETPTATEAEPRTAHERSHKRVDQRAQEKFRWPWERIANESLNLNNDDDDGLVTTGDTLHLTDEAPKIPKTQLVSFQRFIWEGASGYITAYDDKNLVFGVQEVEGKVIDVILKRRNPDDIFQRWICLPVEKDEQFTGEIDYEKSFLVVSKARPTMALTILLPSCTDEDPSEMKVTCVGAQITLQQRRYEENGCANQKWRYDRHLGFFFAFNTSLTDKEITAANRANICSYAVHTEDLSQPGFTVSILNNSDQVEDVPVCLACAQAMRGKYRLTKIEAEQKFSCAIGKRTNLKFQGPFHCLNHKADLSRNEAENTLIEWQNRFEQLREEASVHQIARTLSAAKTVQIVHLLAYRNGDGRTRPGVKLVGSSVIGLLDQAAYRLNLTSAARRLYLSDGTVILTMEDLIQWAETFYLRQYRRRARSAVDGQTNTQAEKSNVANRFLEGNSKDRFDSVPKLSDIKRAMKNESQLDMSYLLKFVIEVWVSIGEPFVYPEAADKRQELRTTQREQRTIVGHDFEREKHTLRQMKGRRISNQSPGELVPQQNPIEPVIRQGHWTQITDVELDKQEDVKVSQTSVKEVRLSQKPETTQPIVTPSLNRLTQHPTTKRVMVYPNGEAREAAVPCSGTTLAEIMNDTKVRLNLMQPVQALFDEHGTIIERFDQLTRDQFVVAATTKTFISRTERHREIEVKASLSRAHRHFGEESTDVRVTSTVASTNLVEPFGPPLLTNNDRPKSAARIPPSRRLPIGPSQTTITEVTPSPRLTKKSFDSTDDDEPNSEIQRITNAKDNDAASTGPSTPAVPPRSLPAATPARAPIAPKRSDSDDDDDEFMKMIKGK